MRLSVAALPLVFAAAVLVACSPSSAEDAASAHTLSEAEFSEMQGRGEVTMGVDQYTSTHLFDALPNGGRIELQRNEVDPEGVEQIRSHLQQIAGAFGEGDFSDPTAVHGHEMPGTAVMAERKDAITYSYAELARGGEVVISTDDPEALEAIHAFMAAQRGEHRAEGHAGH